MNPLLLRKVRRREVLLLIALLSAPLVLPGSETIASLRGRTRVEAELRNAQARGYYEGLLEKAPARKSDPADDIDAPPPPGSTTFDDSGLVERLPTYARRKILPSKSVIWNGTRVTSNSHGYRTPEVAIPKPAGTYRVVVMGSSNTMGHGVDDEECYTRLLERWLLGVAKGRPVEVVNLAISGDSPSQQLLRMRAEVERFQPDWILNDASVLDFSLEELQLAWALKGHVPIPLDYVREAVHHAGLSADDAPETFARKCFGEFDALLGGAFDGRAAEARRMGVPLAIVLLPRADKQAESPHILRSIRRYCRRNDVPCINLFDVFEGLEPSEFRVAPWDKHPSALGHRLIFEGLRDALVRQGGPPGLPIQP